MKRSSCLSKYCVKLSFTDGYISFRKAGEPEKCGLDLKMKNFRYAGIEVQFFGTFFLLYTAGLNVDLDPFFELAELMVGMS